MRDRLCIILPCYNEEEILGKSAAKVLESYNGLKDSGRISGDSRILFVDDGSSDRTWDIIEKLHSENPVFCGLKLARNYGHQTAIFAGMEHDSDCRTYVHGTRDINMSVMQIDQLLG